MATCTHLDSLRDLVARSRIEGRPVPALSESWPRSAAWVSVFVTVTVT